MCLLPVSSLRRMKIMPNGAAESGPSLSRRFLRERPERRNRATEDAGRPAIRQSLVPGCRQRRL